MRGDPAEAVVDAGQGVQTFDLVATPAGRLIGAVPTRAVVEVRAAGRTGTPGPAGPSMTSPLIARLIARSPMDEWGRAEVTTRHRLERIGRTRTAAEAGGRPPTLRRM
jgi:hypothetical protein